MTSSSQCSQAEISPSSTVSPLQAPLVRVLQRAVQDDAAFPDAGHRAGPRAFARFAMDEEPAVFTVPDASAASAERAVEYFARYARP